MRLLQVAVKVGTRKKLRAILCLAENAVSEKAYRNDDVIHMLSGKTVEVQFPTKPKQHPIPHPSCTIAWICDVARSLTHTCSICRG